MTVEPLSPGYRFTSDEAAMERALALAAEGQGHVEPNPMVGSVLVDDDRCLISEGYHERYGEPHAEANALRHAGDRARGQTLFVTLEPCAHHGKQPPCSDAVVAAGVKRLVCAMRDPFPQVAGKGFEKVRSAGIDVDVGLLESAARRLNAPFLKRVATGRPYVIAKYAMTLDGKMATATGHSMWISGPESRARVHEIRGRMDAILVGAGTAQADDPRLTVRPPGPRVPVRVVLDSRADRVRPDSYLAKTASEIPTRVYHTSAADPESVHRLADCGVTLVEVSGDGSGRPAVDAVMDDLGQLGMTNVLLEGGASLLGAFRDADEIDEYRVFLAPKVIGAGLGPLGGGASGLAEIPEAANVEIVSVDRCGEDVAIRAIVTK